MFLYIEDNLKAPITLEQLSRISDLSVFQLIRLFDRFIGMTPIAYIRARRLASSLPQLLAGETVLSVALDWGFEYEQSYIRAFREAYGITPARFRRVGTGAEIVEVPNLESFTVSADGIVGKAKVLVRPAFSIAGELKQYHYLDNMLRGKGLLEGVNDCITPVYSAACRNPSPGVFKQQYLVQNSAGADNCAIWEFPSGQWANFEYIGFHPLDTKGVGRVRLMMSLVIGNWFTDNALYWDGNFIETINIEKCTNNYSEITFSCFTKGYTKNMQNNGVLGALSP